MYLIERDSNNDILQSYAIYEERGIQLEKLMNLQKKKDLLMKLLLFSF